MKLAVLSARDTTVNLMIDAEVPSLLPRESARGDQGERGLGLSARHVPTTL